MNLGPHAAFILGAYGAGALIIAILIGWVMVDYRIHRRILADLDKSGVMRRSERVARDAAGAPVQSA